MQKRTNNYLEITDLKDMLNKTKELYGNNIAYKIREKNISKRKNQDNANIYKTFTHKEVREMIDSLRNRVN